MTGRLWWWLSPGRAASEADSHIHTFAPTPKGVSPFMVVFQVHLALTSLHNTHICWTETNQEDARSGVKVQEEIKLASYQKRVLIHGRKEH